MVLRNCAGGVVFDEGNVFLLKSDKSEWVLPKGVVRDGQRAPDVALARVYYETGVKADIVAPCGETSYEFNSLSRSKYVRNVIQWYLMKAQSSSFRINFQQGFLDGGWFPLDTAVELVAHEQDAALIKDAYALLKGGV